MNKNDPRYQATRLEKDREKKRVWAEKRRREIGVPIRKIKKIKESLERTREYDRLLAEKKRRALGVPKRKINEEKKRKKELMKRLFEGKKFITHRLRLINGKDVKKEKDCLTNVKQTDILKA
jgi:hypothetical protein